MRSWPHLSVHRGTEMGVAIVMTGLLGALEHWKARIVRGVNLKRVWFKMPCTSLLRRILRSACQTMWALMKCRSRRSGRDDVE